MPFAHGMNSLLSESGVGSSVLKSGSLKRPISIPTIMAFKAGALAAKNNPNRHAEAYEYEAFFGRQTLNRDLTNWISWMLNNFACCFVKCVFFISLDVSVFS